jgi:DNA-binding IclR family transcriptional regulator
VQQILGEGPLQKVTPFTTESVQELRRELEDIKRTGIAFSRQGAIVGVGAVAAGVRNAAHETIAGLNITFPIHLVPESSIEALAHLTMQAAERISQRVGSLSLKEPYQRSDASE